MQQIHNENYTDRSGGRMGSAFGFYLSASGTTSDSEPSWSNETFSTIRTGYSNPQWKDIVERKLGNAGTPYTRQGGRSISNGFLDVKLMKPGSQDWYRWHGNLPSLPSTPSDEALISDIALAKLKRKMASDRADVEVMANVLQDIYEFKDTIHGTLDTMSSLLSRFAKIFNRNIGRRSKVGLIGDLAALWLEWSFGIAPTIADARDLARAIQAVIDRTDHTKRFQASHYRDARNSSVDKIFTYYAFDVIAHNEVSSRYSVKFIDGVHYRIFSAQDYGAFANHFHVAPTDFIPTLWELLPWSWVFDYFTTIGDVLSDYFQSDANESFYVIKNTLRRNTYKTTYQVVPKAPWKIVKISHTPREVETYSFTRTLSSSLPHRIFRFRTPYEMENHMWKKAANLLAVAIGLQNSSALRSLRGRL